MRSPGESLFEEVLKVKYTRRLSTECPPEFQRVPGPVESTAQLLNQYPSDLPYNNI